MPALIPKVRNAFVLPRFPLPSLRISILYNFPTKYAVEIQPKQYPITKHKIIEIAI